ncbi:PsiF family protein [Methyloferula stellata]|uniref:PsiF family protein n=1 Tax=Methyloferula stellata TaxID=876270 RepID=UPI00036321A6|nr:PsiF family protein [Methyloferula stellata]
MKTTLFIVLASALYAGAALAQTASPPATSAPADAAAPATTAAAAQSGKPKPKEVLATCRDEAKSQGLKGDARKTAVQECFVKQRPDLVAWEKCRTDPEMKGKAKGERKALMKECLKANKG